MGEILYEVHREDLREGWWSELKGGQKSQGQSFDKSSDIIMSRTEKNMLCSILSYVGF